MRKSFGTIETFLLLGGGPVLSRLASSILKRGLSVIVYSSERHLAEFVSDGTTLRDALKAAGIACRVAEDINTDHSLDTLIGQKTLAISFGSAWIFRKPFIERFRGRLLNVHAAPLPEHRGAGGYTWRILSGDHAGCSLIHLVDDGLDTGPIIKKAPYKFPDSCRIPKDFEAFQHEKDILFLEKFISEVAVCAKFDFIEQDPAASTYFPRLYTQKHGAIDWNWTAPNVVRFICAFDDPYPGAFSLLSGRKIFLKKASMAKERAVFHPYQSGLVYRVHKGMIFIAAPEGGLTVEQVLDDGGTDIKAAIRPGSRLWTPQECLDEARRFHAVYTPKGIRL